MSGSHLYLGEDMEPISASALIEELKEENARLARRIEQLETALFDFGSHLPCCPKRISPDRECTCGLSAARREEE